VQISRKNPYWNACSVYPVYVWRVRLFPNTCHVRVDTHCPRHTLLQELNHVGGRPPFSHPQPPPQPQPLSVSLFLRNYKVIGDICESSFNPFAPSMNMQKRRQNEPTMFRRARSDVEFASSSRIDVPGSFECEANRWSLHSRDIAGRSLANRAAIDNRHIAARHSRQMQMFTGMKNCSRAHRNATICRADGN